MNMDFEKSGGLVPAIIQDANTKNVLMLGYMNKTAIEQTIETGLVTFFSRSKNRLWRKGESSGNVLRLVELKKDCDSDALLVLVNPVGNTCHKGSDSCFGFENRKNFSLKRLESIIQNRKEQDLNNSYTSSLLRKGINKIAQKVGEEAVELIIEAKDDDKDLFLGEAADLIYHYLILLAAKDYSLQDVLAVLENRNGLG
jgi:phosphoribosyl-AMP cyclohydrolase / phosphoribosyl-ATP pyrophosphohydrolase